jgi:RNA polymerase sigma factor (sigma-70 family)
MRIQSGETEAIETLWAANVGLVAHIAKKYMVVLERCSDCDFEDLMQAGFLGICRAAGEYDPGKGAPFSSYASFFLRKEMRRALGIRTSKRDASFSADSLDVPLFDDDNNETTLRDTLTAPEEDDIPIEREELQAAVRAAVSRMRNKTNRCAIEEYYWEGKTERQIAESSGVSCAAIGARLYNGYRELRRDITLRKWAVDYGVDNIYRHKGVRAFKSSFTSVVEDIVLRTLPI